MKIKLIACQAILAIILFSCKEYKTSEHGFEYKFIVDKDTDPISTDQFVLFRADYYNEDNYMFSSHQKEGTMPAIIKVTQMTLQDTMPLLNALTMMTAGDSAVFKFNADNLFKNSFRMPLPDSIGSESNIFARVSIEEVLTEENFEKYMASLDSVEFEKQKAKLDQHLAEEGVEYNTTESGLRYVVTEEGEGEMAQPGDTVKVHYTGMLLDGTVFDSSVDRGQPIEFPIGVGRVIPGWDEGIALLKEGAKAKLYIPSKLGYGSRGAGRAIPPNSVLVFEVELVEVKGS